MCEPLQLLECDRVAPEQRYRRAVLTAHTLRVVLPLGWPLWMCGAWVLPLHDGGRKSRLAIVASQRRRPRLLVDEGDRGPDAEETLVDAMPGGEIGTHDVGGSEWANDLGVPAANELRRPFGDERAEGREPIRVDLRGRLKGVRRCLDRHRQLSTPDHLNQRPVAAFDHSRAVGLFDRGEREIQVKERVALEGASSLRPCGRPMSRHHAASATGTVRIWTPRTTASARRIASAAVEARVITNPARSV